MAGGAPRLLGSNGRLIHYQFSRKSSFLSPRFTSKSVSKFADYTGYSVIFCKLYANGREVLVAGAPVADLRRGTVEIYKQTTKFSILDELKNPTKQIGSYFGSSLAVADVNGDGYQDLLVGAPYYYTSIEEGIVIVYINNKRGNLDLSPVKLSGDAGPRGRFGMSMVGARDLNNDGYEDVAIGAPNGGVDGRGVVYIYEGSRNGLSNQYSQKIVPSEFGLVGLSLTAFGSSLSGGLDMDDNGYSEVTYEYIIDEKLLDNKKRGVFVENSVPKYRLSKRLHIYHRVCVDHLVYMEKAPDNIDDPVVFKATFKYQAATSCKLCPIMRDTSAKALATYSKNCGTDMICGADLKVMAKIRLPHNKTEIHAGVTENFSFEILVKNYGENAFLTKITTLIPRQLSIIGVHNLKEKFAFLDWNFEYFNETHNQLALDAGNPIGNLEEEHFEVRLTAKSLHTVVDYLSFHVNVTTNSEENNIADNTVVVNANVVLVADMTISGVAIPERVIYSNSRSAKDIGTFILHSFLIQNKGPSTVDNSRVDIYFPEKVENDYILNLISITAEGPVNCYVNDSSYNPLGLQLNLPTGNDRKQTVNRRKRRSIKDKVDCLTGQCQVFKCDLGRMARGESVTIKINSSLVESTFAKKLKRDTYVVVRAVVVSESIRQPRLNFPDSSEPLLTVLSPGRSVDVKGTIPWWIILISIIAGLVLVAGVVFVLYKSGFFNRKKKDYSFSSVADFPDD
ncbi:integrin alpha-V-like [Rhopilema esculentum]|uniref:integrin alpha-V-like n=1 Tax=Rhopilema esculentum TaxID=499914 RepID=UPI0031D99B95